MLISAILKKTSPLVLGLIIAVGSMSAYFLFVGHPVWGDCDDVFMSMIAAGISMVSIQQPSADLVFIHPFYGWFISHLYMWEPEVPWYGIFFILIVGLSLVTLNYSILRLRRQLNFSIVVICATIGTVLPSLWHLQFTIVAGLATMAGLILLLSFFMCEPAIKKSFIVGILTSLCLLLIGAMIRFQSVLLVCVLFTPFAIIVFFKFARSTQSNNFKKKYILKFLIVGIIVGVSMIGLQAYKQRYYGNSPEWTKWFSLNKAKSEFLDYGRIKYNEQTRNIFDSMNWSKTDYDMIMSWQYVDPVKFAPEKFIYVVNSLQKGTLGWEYSFGQIVKMIKRTKAILDRAYSLMLCILVGALMIRWRKWNFLYVSSIVFATIAVLFYLYFGLDRAPLRVLMPLWISVLWMMLLVAAKSNNSSTTQVGRWKGCKTVARVILIFMLSVAVYKDFGYARDIVKNRVIGQRSLEHRIKTWNTNLPQNSIIYNIGISFPFPSHLPLKSFAYLRSIKGFISTSWINQTPFQRQIINALGLSDDFYASLAQKEHVYMVKRKVDSEKELSPLRNHYNERYGLKLSLVEEPNLPHLYRMVFEK